MAAEDIDKIIFIGSSVNYKPIRDRIVAEPGIAGRMEFNPMTAVSEGAAIFAEAVDWTVAVVLEKKIFSYTFEINSLDSGRTSGLVELKNKALVTVPLYRRGENKFRVEVFDKGGDGVFLENDTIIITQTFANVGALLAAHSIGIEVKEKLGSNISRLDYFVREGDTLPAKGQKKFRAGRKIRAGSDD